MHISDKNVRKSTARRREKRKPSRLSLSLCLFLLMVLCLASCGKEAAAVQDGAGYVNLQAVSGSFCLVDESGVVYALDLESGEKEALFRGPADFGWIADSKLNRLYYRELTEATSDTVRFAIHSCGIVSGSDEVIYEDAYLNLLSAGTENLLLEQQLNREGGVPLSSDYFSINAYTGVITAEFVLQDGFEPVSAIGSLGNTAYIWTENSDNCLIEQRELPRTRLEAWDLSDGTQTVLLELSDRLDEAPVLSDDGCIRFLKETQSQDRTDFIFRQYSLSTGTLTEYAGSIGGSALQLSPAGDNLLLVCAPADEKNKVETAAEKTEESEIGLSTAPKGASLWAIDAGSGVISRLSSFDFQDWVSVRSFVTDGNRFAALSDTSGGKTVLALGYLDG